MNAQHTPAPWWIGRPKRVLGNDTRGQRYIHAKDRTIAVMLDGTDEDARCIAAAPELLAVATALIHNDDLQVAIDLARAALAKINNRSTS
jgi:hypothetical protein